MSEAERLALSRGTLTSGIDLAQVQAARHALERLAEDMPIPAAPAEPVRWRTLILAGALIGALVWMVRG